MKHIKHTLFLLISLLPVVHATAQPDTRRMNISIGIFSASATSYDYEGAIGVVGSTGHTVDDIEPGDMFWDDLSRYRVDSVEVIVAGSSATVWVTDLYSAGAPQSGKGTLGKPSPNMGLQPMTENGSNFITEAQEAKILTDNLNRMDSLAGGADGNGILDSLPAGPVAIDASANSLQVTNTSLTRFSAAGIAEGALVVSGASVIPSSLSHIEGTDTSSVQVSATGGIGLNATRYVDIQADSMLFTDLVFRRTGTGILLTHNNSSRWDMYQDGNGGAFNIYTYDLTPSDPYGLSISNSAPTIRTLSLGDYGGDFSGSRLIMDDANQNITLGYYGEFGIRIQGVGNILTLGDHAYENDGTAIRINDGTRSIKIGDVFSSDRYGISLLNDGDDQYLKMGDIRGNTSGLHISIEDDDDSYAKIRMGDIEGTADGTRIEIDEIANSTLIHSDAGLTAAGAAYSYKLPVTNPTANQVLGEGATDDNILEWVNTTGDGNGIISALPAGDVNFSANSNDLFIYDFNSFEVQSTGDDYILLTGATYEANLDDGVSYYNQKFGSDAIVFYKDEDDGNVGKFGIDANSYFVVHGELSSTPYSYRLPKANPGTNQILSWPTPTTPTFIDLPAGGNGIIAALPLEDVSIDAAGNSLKLDKLDSLALDTSIIFKPQETGGRAVMQINEADFRIESDPGNDGGEFGFQMYSSPTLRRVTLGDFGSDYNQTAISLNDVNNSISLNGNYSSGVRVVGNVTTIGDYLQDSDETLIALDNSGDMTLKSFNNIHFAGDGWQFTMPTSAPGANQVLGEGTSNDDELEWVDLPAADGNGIIGALPSSAVVVDALSNPLQVTNTSLTRFAAAGIAQGELVVSGSSVIPGSLSHIEGGDTTKVSVNAAGGLDLKATRTIDFQADSLSFDDLIIRKSSPTGGILAINNYDGRWDISQKGSAGMFNIFAYDVTPGDPIGMFIDGTTGEMMLGDRDADIHGSRIDITNNSLSLSAAYDVFLKGYNNFSVLGDAENQGWGITTSPDTVMLGTFNSGYNITIKMENDDDQRWVNMGEQSGDWVIKVLDDDGTDKIQMGDLTAAGNSTKLLMDDDAATFQLNANNGTTVSGATYTYDLPTATPTASDSLDRAAVWREGASGFKVVNDGDFRTINASGNILPYDDVIEVIQGITVHLPAPSPTFQGKIYHIIAGGTVSGGSPSTIDVVDGSSTIELGASLTLDNAFEVYTLTCNGSQWLVLNNKL